MDQLTTGVHVRLANYSRPQPGPMQTLPLRSTSRVRASPKTSGQRRTVSEGNDGYRTRVGLVNGGSCGQAYLITGTSGSGLVRVDAGRCRWRRA